MRGIVPPLALALALALAPPALAAVIQVPADHPTIQAAIAAAGTGDEINVAPGLYAGPVDFSGKTVTVRSSGGNGIVVGVGSTVIGNTSVLNTSAGMVLSSAGYVHNVIRSNGSTVSGGIQMGTNVCDDTTTCP